MNIRAGKSQIPCFQFLWIYTQKWECWIIVYFYFQFFWRSSTLFSIMVAPIYIPTNIIQGFSFHYNPVWQIFWLKTPQRECPLFWKKPLPLLQNYYFKIGPPLWEVVTLHWVKLLQGLGTYSIKRQPILSFDFQAMRNFYLSRAEIYF